MKILLNTYVLFESRSYSPSESVDVPDILGKKLIAKGHGIVANPSFYKAEQPTVSYEPTVEAQSTTPKRRRSKAVS